MTLREIVQAEAASMRAKLIASQIGRAYDVPDNEVARRIEAERQAAYPCERKAA